MTTEDKLYPIIHQASIGEQTERSLEHWRYWVHDDGKVERQPPGWLRSARCYILKTAKEFVHARAALVMKESVPVPGTDGVLEIEIKLELFCDGLAGHAEKVLKKLGGGPRSSGQPSERFETWLHDWFDRYVKDRGAKVFLEDFFRDNGKEIAKNLKEAAAATGLTVTASLSLVDPGILAAIPIDVSLNSRLSDCAKDIGFDLRLYLETDPRDPSGAAQATKRIEAFQTRIRSAAKEWLAEKAGLDEVFDNLPMVQNRLLAALKERLAGTGRVPKDAHLVPSRDELDKLELPLTLECKGEVQHCCFKASETTFAAAFELTLQRKSRAQFYTTALDSTATLQKAAVDAVAGLLVEQFSQWDAGSFLRSKRAFEKEILADITSSSIAAIPGYAAANLTLTTNLDRQLKEEDLSDARRYATAAENNSVRLSFKVRVDYTREARALWSEGKCEPAKQVRETVASAIANSLGIISPAHIYLYWEKPLRAGERTVLQKVQEAIEAAISTSGLARMLEMEVTLHDDAFVQKLRRLMNEIFIFNRMDVLPEGMPFQVSFSFQARIIDVTEGGWERLQEELPSLEKIRAQIAKWVGLSASRLVRSLDSQRMDESEDFLSSEVSNNIETILGLVVRIEGIQRHPTTAEIVYFTHKMGGLVDDINAKAREIQNCRLVLETLSKKMLDYITWEGDTSAQNYRLLEERSKDITKRKRNLEEENSTSQKQLAEIKTHIHWLEAETGSTGEAADASDESSRGHFDKR